MSARGRHGQPPRTRVAVDSNSWQTFRSQPKRWAVHHAWTNLELMNVVREEAQRYVRRKRIAYAVFAIWIALSVMWLIIDLLDDSSSFWFYWPMFGTGVAVAITVVALLGIGGLLGADWEQREIDKYLQRRGSRRDE